MMEASSRIALLRLILGGLLLLFLKASLDLYYQLRDFVRIAELAQDTEEFSFLFNSHKGRIKILCKDASHFLQRRLKSFKATVAISATITPFPFYRDLLGFPVDKTIFERFPYPFSDTTRMSSFAS